MSSTETWRQDLKKAVSPKERVAIPRVKMNELAPDIRNKNYEEVNSGLTHIQALTEAKRCLDCPKPTCVDGCPVGIDIPSFIKNIERNEIGEAANILKKYSALPAVCGRVCPQEKQCEQRCMHLKMGKESVAIGYLERFAADFAIAEKAIGEREEGERQEGERRKVKVQPLARVCNPCLKANTPITNRRERKSQWQAQVLRACRLQAIWQNSVIMLPFLRLCTKLAAF
jgi:Fe-S oxidoreductase